VSWAFFFLVGWGGAGEGGREGEGGGFGDGRCGGRGKGGGGEIYWAH